MYACICKGVTEAQVRGVGAAGFTDPDDLIRILGLDEACCCGRCARHIEEFVELACEGAAEMPGSSALVAA